MKNMQNDPKAIEALMSRLFPEDETKRCCLEHLAESIQLAHECCPDRWSVTIPGGDKVRLNVGMIETLMFQEGYLHLVLDAETIPDALKELASAPGHWMSPAGVYRNVPTSVLYDFPIASACLEIALARSSHFALIEKAARTARHPSIAKAYSHGVTEYLANFISVPLVPPTYYRPSEESSGVPVPRRVSSLCDRIVRDTAVTLQVKQLHDYCCQVCGICMETPVGPYAEGAHVHPLGSPHNGPDLLGNVLCLCPNHHVLLDYGAISIRDDLTLIGMEGKLRTVSGHKPDTAYLRYHREIILGKV